MNIGTALRAISLLVEIGKIFDERQRNSPTTERADTVEDPGPTPVQVTAVSPPVLPPNPGPDPVHDVISRIRLR